MTAPAGRSHYRILGVAPTASAEEIRVAYLNLARALHPDRLGDASDAERRLAERRMREVNDAYQVLRDRDRRADYDRPTAQPTPQRSTDTAESAADSDELDQFDDDNRDRPPWDEDDVELSPIAYFALRWGPLLLALFVAAALFIGTAYAGGR